MNGRSRISQKMGGRYGGTVRLGDALVPRHAFFEFEGDNGHPDLSAHFEIRDGRPQCVDFHVRSKAGGRGVRSSDLSTFSLDNFAVNVFEQLATHVVDEYEGRTVALQSSNEADVWEVRRRLGDAMHVPGKSRDRIELEKVAEVYKAHPSAPAKAVEQALGLHPRTASRRIKKAREEGLIGENEPRPRTDAETIAQARARADQEATS